MIGESAADGAISRTAIEGEMTIFTAGETKARLLAALPRCQAWEVDLSGVTEIDAAGLQLLVLLKREAAAQDTALRFAGPSQAVLELLDLANLGGFFGDALPGGAQAQGGEKHP